MPAVSIITPTYNRPHLLSEAIQSVQAQTFNDWEMLIIDDGSEPSAQSTVDMFGDPRLRYVQLSHVGRSAARNQGLELARGEYIGFLDDDDLYHPNKLELEIACFQSLLHIDTVGSGYRIIGKTGEVASTYRTWLKKPEISKDNCLFGVPLITCSILIRRQAIERMERWFDPSLDLREDTDFFIRLFLAGARFAWVKEVLSDYRAIRDRSWSVLLEGYRIGRQLLEGFFQSRTLQPDIAAQQREALTHHDLLYAWLAYSYQASVSAQYFLLQALIRDPELAGKRAHFLFKELATFSLYEPRVEDPDDYIDYVFAHLPPSLHHLAERRAELNQLIEELNPANS